MLLQILRQLYCRHDVLSLGPLTSRGKQDDQFKALLNEIDPIPRSVIETHFRNAFADRFHITRISVTQANELQSTEMQPENMRAF